jgi:hypothetical protein
VLEDPGSMKVIKDTLFRVMEASKHLAPEKTAKVDPKSKADLGKIDQNSQGITTYQDFRDLNEEIIFLFCSFAMSQNFTVSHLAQHVMPIGQKILAHCNYSLQKAQESGEQMPLTQICSLSSINAMLESLAVVLRDDKVNKELQEQFEVGLLLIDIIKVIKHFDHKGASDNAVKEQFEAKIKNISLNLELIVKLMYFAPVDFSKQRENASIKLIHKMFEYHRYRKTGIFAVYCVALKIQDSEQECIGNLVPVFKDKEILKELQGAIKDVDVKFSKLKDP